MALEILTFGCRLNAAESEVMRARAAEAGLADAVLVNTCAVTAEAVRQARQAIRRARRLAPDRRIVVAGCAAQIDPEAFAAMAEVDLVLGNAEKLSAESYRGLGAAVAGRGPGSVEAVRSLSPAPGGGGGKIRVNDILSLRDSAAHMVDAFADRARAFVEIQNGCDHRCSFCIIPFGRGNSRSAPMGAVVEQARRLVDRGISEIVLTGVDLTAYGADLPGRPRLGVLVRNILKHVQELRRLRLSSIDSIEADADLMRALAEEERLMPHLHLSLQAGDDLVLKRMKRRHSRADAIRFCNEARRLRPDVAIGADLIAGFPTETNAMFENSLSLVEECGLTFLHVFPFSPRPGTPAARMPQVPRAAVKERAGRLRAAGERALAARLEAEVGRRRSVLVERNGFGRTEHYLPAALAEGGDRPGAILAAKIVAHDGRRLMGSVPAGQA
jgi:threonylcarbamoyladenosine tRNA methylthiotransferase MtaB